MASYTAAQLKGAGVLLADNITTGLPIAKFLITNTTSTGSAYFTFETVRNSNGFYDSSSPTNGSGLVRIDIPPIGATTVPVDLIQDNYIWSIVIPSGGVCGFTFIPTSQVDASTVYLRGTGGISLELTQT
tara:strand:- start:200 stop:589 length:390 start_codon:yes stop_codon:yes gene_type:complete